MKRQGGLFITIEIQTFKNYYHFEINQYSSQKIPRCTLCSGKNRRFRKVQIIQSSSSNMFKLNTKF